MTSEFLSVLDAAIEQRCACGCGMLLTASPSAYFASEMCADRYHKPARDRVHAQDVVRVMRQVFAKLAEGLAAALRSFAEVVKKAVAAVERLNLAPAAGPSDPRERALWLRRNRNTGPRTAPRAPRRIDPSGGFRADARGNSTYRPIKGS